MSFLARYGAFTSQMADVVAPIVSGRHVWDLGAGQLGYAQTLIELGALRVTAVDKDPMPAPYDARIEHRCAYFSDLMPASMDVVWWSWPINHYCRGLDALLDQAEKVIYLGCNTGGVACGHVRHFERLMHRRVDAHVPDRRNSLIVYGEPWQRCTPLVPEEIALSRPDEVSSWCKVHEEWQQDSMGSAHALNGSLYSRDS